MGNQAGKGGQLGLTKPAGKGIWGPASQEGRAVGGDQVSRGGQFGAIRLAGKQFGGYQAGRQKQLGASSPGL